MTLNLNNSRIREFIPNVIHEVEGESSLYDKLLPWIDSARTWLEQNFLGSFEPPASLASLAEKIIVCKAFSEAIPSLDVTLSPAGFAVINTDGRAPASKERVERLIASLNSYVNTNLYVLSYELPKYPEWRSSLTGQWFLASFMPDMKDVQQFKGDKDLLSTYRSMRDIALRFEQELAERFLGYDFLNSLRSEYPNFERQGSKDLSELIRRAELRYIASNLRDQKTKCPDAHEIWHLARPIIAQLNYWPDLKAEWETEMADKIKVEPFKNNFKGGYYF